MKKLAITFVILIGAFCSKDVMANYFCQGKINYLGMGTQYLTVDNGFGRHYLCDLNQEYCKAWTSLITAAKFADKAVLIYYSSTDPEGGNQNGGKCKDIGSWVLPSDAVYHIHLE